jgi:8-oxo-dGTP pyrophosphatase MutT (NUDIX family)
MTALTEKLDSEKRNLGSPYLRPVDAATLVLLDRSSRTPKVLMGKRSPKLKFMPGKFVFPGGRVDLADRMMRAAGALSPRTETQLMTRATRMTPQRCRALAMAAVRETFEETGYLIGDDAHGTDGEAPDGSWRDFASHGLLPAIDRLVFVARAITPPGRPRRFDTRFFAADVTAAAKQIPPDIGPDSELTELVWVPIREAGKLDLPIITQVMIEELRQRVETGVLREAPAPFYHERHRRFVRELV